MRDSSPSSSACTTRPTSSNSKRSAPRGGGAPRCRHRRDTRRRGKPRCYAAGSGLAAVDALERGDGDAAFCAVRPPGHHAEPRKRDGVLLVEQRRGRPRRISATAGERVVIVDWDAHHGNGTQDMFWPTPTCMYVSMHEWPLYPGTGRLDDVGTGAGVGTTVNFPLPAGATGDIYLDAIDTVVAPVGERFAPDVGARSRPASTPHRADPLTGLGLSAGDYADLTARVVGVRPRPGAPSSFLEGGYDLDALRDSVAATVSTLVAAPSARSRRPAAAPAVPWSGRRPICTVERACRPPRFARRPEPTRSRRVSRVRPAGRAARRCRSDQGDARDTAGGCSSRAGSRSTASLRRRARRVRRAHQGGVAAVRSRRRPPRAHRDARRSRRSRPSASRSRSCRSNAPRSSSRAREADFAYSVSGLGRFRVNVMRQRGSVGLVLRRVQSEIPTFEDLGLPPVVRKLTEHQRGLVLVTGPTGSGKTTTLGAMIDHINDRLQPPHRDDRRPDRDPARRQGVDREPARGRHRHRRLPRRARSGCCARTPT